MNFCCERTGLALKTVVLDTRRPKHFIISASSLTVSVSVVARKGLPQMQSLQLGPDFRTLVRIQTFLTKLVRIFVKSPDFSRKLQNNA